VTKNPAGAAPVAPLTPSSSAKAAVEAPTEVPLVAAVEAPVESEAAVQA
jgi:hypothetical protein